MPIILLVFGLSACNKPAGELVGAYKAGPRGDAEPYGMLFIRKGAFLMGANEQSASVSIGGVTATVTFAKAPAENSETPKPGLNGSDNHGDGFDPGLWVSVMTVSAMAMAVLLIGKKKEIF